MRVVSCRGRNREPRNRRQKRRLRGQSLSRGCRLCSQLLGRLLRTVKSPHLPVPPKARTLALGLVLRDKVLRQRMSPPRPLLLGKLETVQSHLAFPSFKWERETEEGLVSQPESPVLTAEQLRGQILKREYLSPKPRPAIYKPRGIAPVPPRPSRHHPTPHTRPPLRPPANPLLRSRRVTIAPSWPRPAPSQPIPGSAPGASQWRLRGSAPRLPPRRRRRWGSVGKPACAHVGRRKQGGGAGTWGCCSRVLGRRAEQVPGTQGLPEAPRAHDEQELWTRACRAPDSAPRKPRPGRAARGFHGDGKQASTASATTAKSPAFHPPLGAQGDDRGAGCEEERERRDSEPEVNNKRMHLDFPRSPLRV
nr:PREDICTED: unconventional myosin-XV-like [Equus przewalskii]